jgi:small conductance mechanosensitive channel
MSRIYGHFTLHETSAGVRILLILLLAVLAHAAVKVIHRLSDWMKKQARASGRPLAAVMQEPKVVTVTSLAVSTVTVVIYFAAIGMILEELGVSLTAYLASASVVGLAISFGSQGLVQDIVIGLTLVFWDAMDVNDMVEIVGPSNIVIGRVEEIGMRFTKVVNLYNQRVFIPNRSIGNVSRFPHGGVDAYADSQVPTGADEQKVIQIVNDIAIGMWSQFGAIILTEPIIGKVESVHGGNWKFVRVHFKIWPGQGGLIENTYRQEVVRALRELDPNYAEWQVPVTYRAGTASKGVR